MRVQQLTILLFLLIALVLFGPVAGALPPSNHWVVILDEPPVVQRHPGRIEHTRAAAEPYRRHLQDVQTSLRGQIEQMDVRVTGSVQHVLNALFVKATPAQAEALRKLPGVKMVVAERRYHMEDQLTLSDVQGAWNASAVGGESNAGAGIKIAIIDSGIDQTHPSFKDDSYTLPAGFPKCDVPSNCQLFTNKKVIVARSYVSTIVETDVPTGSTNPAAQSRPDDLSARDLIGHGTAVASVAAGMPTTFNGTTVVGVAPKAYLGNYKIFASDDVNPNGSGNIVQALDDAVNDGMDIVNLSLGGPAFGGPLDTGAACGAPAGQICDALAFAIEQAVQSGQVIVVAAAGNEGANGYQFNLGCSSPPCFSAPTFATVGSPGYAPFAIAAGGLQNDVTYVQSVEVPGNGVPSNLQRINAIEGFGGTLLGSPLTAPMMDVAKAGDSTGLLCNALPAGTLTGEIAIILRGSCDSTDESRKVINAEDAGAVGVIIIDNGSGLSLFQAGSTSVVPGIPALMVDQSDGGNLKSYVDSHPGAAGTLDPSPNQLPARALGYLPKSVASFASRGPVTATGALKPDVSAAATDFLLAAESYDPNGEIFGFSRYASAGGTSFSTPLVAGAAALVKQANPALTPLQVKSALVNTATLSGLTTSDLSGKASITEVGAGLLQSQNAVNTTVQVIPTSGGNPLYGSTISFGLLTTALPAAQTLTLSNSGTAAVTLTLSVAQPAGLSGTQVQVNNSTSASLTIQGGQTGTLTVGLSGSVPAAGRYEGLIAVTGGPSVLNIPYMFLVGDGVPYDIIPLNTTPPGQPGFDGAVGAQIPWNSACADTNNNCVNDYGPIAIQVIDRFGAPVANVAVQWGVAKGGGAILQGSQYTDTSTNQNGLAGAAVTLGPNPGDQQFTATVNGMVMPFDGTARRVPAINNPGGIVDAASFVAGRAVAPGSWIAVYGTNLSDTTSLAFANCPQCSVLTSPLPMGIDGVAVSFDVPSAGISVAGRVDYISPGQVNVQVPWELAGQTSAIVKVIVNYTYSAEYTLPIASYSPGFFVIDYKTNAVAALDLNYKVITTSHAAVRGNIVQLYLNGLGPVNNLPTEPDGKPGLSNPLADTTATPTITIGGQNAPVQFSGLAPNFVGLYQVNVTVPQGISAGLQPIICQIGGVTSTTAFLPVQ